MKVSITKDVGADKITLSADVADTKEFVKFMGEISFLNRMPDKCDLCGSKDLFLNHRLHKGYDFFEVRCAKCGAQKDLSTTKAGGVLYFKPEAIFKKYSKDNVDKFDQTEKIDV